ncbi:MAG: hypothetical protein IKZ87_01315 [Actinomycetaceae bacterium]|nr:hypothetical protein [Actinomycetaceae bacterium]
MTYWVVQTELGIVDTRVEVEECDGDPSECTGLRAYSMRTEAEAAAKRIITADRELRRLITENHEPIHLNQKLT